MTTSDYWRLLEITGDQWSLLELAELLEIAGEYDGTINPHFVNAFIPCQTYSLKRLAMKRMFTASLHDVSVINYGH